MAHTTSEPLWLRPTCPHWATSWWLRRREKPEEVLENCRLAHAGSPATLHSPISKREKVQLKHGVRVPEEGERSRKAMEREGEKRKVTVSSLDDMWQRNCADCPSLTVWSSGRLTLGKRMGSEGGRRRQRVTLYGVRRKGLHLSLCMLVKAK